MLDIKLPPDIESKVELDMKYRLHPSGLPIHPENDYERHLYARKLKLEGATKEEIRLALLALGLLDVPLRKQEQYISDVLQSCLVGFPDDEGKYLGVYVEAGGTNG